MFEAVVWIAVITGLASISMYRSMAWRSPIAMWREATQRTSGDGSRAYGELGAFHKLQAKLSEAEPYLKEAIRQNPGFGPALNNLGWIYLDANRLHEAIIIFEQCTARCPRYALGWQDLGIAYARSGKSHEAQWCLQKALFLDPKMERASNALGLMLFYEKHFDEAVDRFSSAMNLNPNHWEYIYNRAITLKYAGKPLQADLDFKRLPTPCPVTRDMIRKEFAQ